MATSLADIQRFVDQNPTLEGLDDESRAGVEELINRGDITRGQPQEEPSFGEQALGAVQTGTKLLTGAGAQVVGGFLSLGPLITKGPEAAEETIKEITEALTFEPEEGTEGARQTQAVGEFVGQQIPFGDLPFAEELGITDASLPEIIKGSADFVGDNIRQATGSDALGAIASGFPELLLNLLGVKAVGKVAKAGTPGAGAKQAGAVKILKEARKLKIKAAKKIKNDLIPVAPSFKLLKTTTTRLYKEVDDLGVTVKQTAWDDFLVRARTMAEDFNVDPILSQKANRVLKRLEQLRGQTLTTKMIDKQRRLAKTAARSPVAEDRIIGVKMIQMLDDLLDNPKMMNIPPGVNPAQINFKLKAARELVGQTKRGELIEDAIAQAMEAPNFEQGLRVEFGKILKNKKLRQGFTDAEKAVIRRVSRGTVKSNLVKMLGTFGFDFSKGGAFGGGAGAVVGASSGIPGAFIVLPFIGTVAKPFATRLTKNNAEFASAVIRAGRNKEKLINVYLKNTPKKLQSAEELADLFVTKGIPGGKLLNKEIVREAAKIARRKREAMVDGLGAAVFATETQAVRQAQDETQPVGAPQ